MTNNNDEETLASEEDVNQTLVTSAQFNPCLRPCSTDCDSGETDCDIVTDNDEKEKMISMSEMKMEIEPKMKDNVHENKIVALQLESSEKDSLSSHLNNENEYKDEDTESSTQPSDNNRQSIRSLAYLLSPRMSVDMGSSAGSSNRTKSEDEEDEVENKVVDTSNSWAAKLFVKAFDNGRVRSATSISQVGYRRKKETSIYSHVMLCQYSPFYCISSLLSPLICSSPLSSAPLSSAPLLFTSPLSSSPLFSHLFISLFLSFSSPLSSSPIPSSLSLSLYLCVFLLDIFHKLAFSPLISTSPFYQLLHLSIYLPDCALSCTALDVPINRSLYSRT